MTLHDGRIVCNMCEDWRAECEARFVIALPTRQKRIDYLRGVPKLMPDRTMAKRVDGSIVMENGVEQKRGKASADALEALVKVIWSKRQVSSASTKPATLQASTAAHQARP